MEHLPRGLGRGDRISGPVLGMLRFAQPPVAMKSVEYNCASLKWQFKCIGQERHKGAGRLEGTGHLVDEFG